jgi:phosphoglycolate phosphatase
VNAALASLGLPKHPLAAYRYFVGEGIEVLAKRVLPPGRESSADIAACLAAINREYGAGLLVKTKPFEGIQELLISLHERKIPLGVTSNKPHELAVRSITANFADGLFSVVLGDRAGSGKNLVRKSRSVPLRGRFRDRHADRRQRRHVSRRGPVGFPRC